MKNKHKHRLGIKISTGFLFLTYKEISYYG